jgi:Helix-turn-helix domain
MIRISKVTMTMRELDRLKCIQGLIDGQLKQTAVATRLGLTTRQVRRLVRRYEQQGPIGLISRLRDRPSNRRLKADAAEHAFGILRSTYADFGPTLAAEKLRERHGVDLAVETVRSLMVAGRPLGAAKTSGAEDSTTPEPPRVPRRAGPNRRLRSSLVRGSSSGVHGVGLRRRCDESFDGGAVCRG